MRDDFDLSERPSVADLAAAKAEIVAFREQHKTLGTAALAIAFIEQRGSATSSELSVLLGLSPEQYPSVELRSSVQGERLVCVGRVWTLGPKAIPGTRDRDVLVSERDTSKREPLTVPTFTPLAPPKAAPTGAPPAAPAAQPHPVDPPTTAASKPSRCRFALWSDGQVEIKIAGLQSVELSRDEVDELIRFVVKTNPGHTGQVA